MEKRGWVLGPVSGMGQKHVSGMGQKQGLRVDLWGVGHPHLDELHFSH